MSLKKRKKKHKPDLKSQSAVLINTPAEQLTKEQKKIISVRMAEIRKYTNDDHTVQNAISASEICLAETFIRTMSSSFVSSSV